MGTCFRQNVIYLKSALVGSGDHSRGAAFACLFCVHLACLVIYNQLHHSKSLKSNNLAIASLVFHVPSQALRDRFGKAPSKHGCPRSHLLEITTRTSQNHPHFPFRNWGSYWPGDLLQAAVLRIGSPSHLCFVWPKDPRYFGPMGCTKFFGFVCAAWVDGEWPYYIKVTSSQLVKSWQSWNELPFPPLRSQHRHHICRSRSDSLQLCLALN